MEKFADCHTAQELYEFLKSIPQPLREVLPLAILDELEPDETPSAVLAVEAYEVRETEGCLERGFRISTQALEEDYDEHQPDEAQEWYDFDPDC
jgi:hypothetical protein